MSRRVNGGLSHRNTEGKAMRNLGGKVKGRKCGALLRPWRLGENRCTCSGNPRGGGTDGGLPPSGTVKKHVALVKS